MAYRVNQTVDFLHSFSIAFLNSPMEVVSLTSNSVLFFRYSTNTLIPGNNAPSAFDNHDVDETPHDNNWKSDAKRHDVRVGYSLPS